MRDIRLFLEGSFESSIEIPLEKAQLHYLVHVMRVESGDCIKVFNGCDGEWFGEVHVTSKKSGHIQLREQMKDQVLLPERHLHFSPLKNTPQSFLIEKATELGVTHFHPILCERSIVRQFKPDKNRLTAIEASEQCERLCVPAFQPLVSLENALKGLPSDQYCFVGDERRESKSLKEIRSSQEYQKPIHIFIGPEGGFTPLEFKRFQDHKSMTLVSLSDHILRAETAALCALAQV